MKRLLLFSVLMLHTCLMAAQGIPFLRNYYAEDYKAMSRLKAFADKHHVAVIVVHHLNKMRDVDDPYDKIA